MTEPVEFLAILSGEDEGHSSAAPVTFKKDFARVVFELPRSERSAAYKLCELTGMGKVLKVRVSVAE